jgi:hypothetical protein
VVFTVDAKGYRKIRVHSINQYTLMNISDDLYFTRILKILKIFGFADYAVMLKGCNRNMVCCGCVAAKQRNHLLNL